MLPDKIQVESLDIAHLALVRHVIEHLGIYEALAEAMPMDPRSVVSDADCLSAMVLNILSGHRVALYRMDSWLRAWDVDTLLGEDCPAEAFSDVRLGKALDHVSTFGVDNLMSAVVRRWLDRTDFGPAWTVRLDTTSLSLYGAYDEQGVVLTAPTPRRGHSKDHRPDLKQLVFGLSIVAGVQMPLCAAMRDGNTSEHKVNNDQISLLADLLPSEDSITLVADSKLVDKGTMGHLLDEGFHFLSRLPRTYSLHAELVDRLGDDVPIGILRELPPDPGGSAPHHATGVSFDIELPVVHPRHGTQMAALRCLVVQSPRLAKQAKAKTARTLNKALDALEKKLRAGEKRSFKCEHDALDFAEKLMSSGGLYEVVVGVERREKTKHRGRGRPKRGAKPEVIVTWQVVAGVITVNAAEVDRREHHASHFVLLTDHLDREIWPDSRLFELYRSQHEIEGHCGFRWLKGPAAMTPMFLKRPERIAAMGVVFMLALMVRNFIQWMVRQQLAATDTTVPYYGDHHDTAIPTAEVIWNLFRSVRVQVLRSGGHSRRQLIGVTDEVRRVLAIFGLDPNDLLIPRHQGLRWLDGS